MRRKKNRNGEMFEAARQMSRDQQRERDKALRLIVDTVGEMGLPPELAAYRVLEIVLSERRLWRRFLRRRFHMQVVNTDGDDHLVGIKNAPVGKSSLLEEWIFLYAVQQHARWELSYRVMIERSVKALDELEGWHWSDDRKRYWASLAALEGFILAQRMTDDLMSLTIQPESIDPRHRELVAAILTGQVEEKISLSQNKRLKATLREQGGNAQTELQKMLPAAVMEEWGRAESELLAGKHSGFRSRITRNLERSGIESRYLERLGKLSSSESSEVAEDTDDLSNFERREEARQQLDSLEKSVTLSKQQAEIWQRLRQGMEIAEIASELEIPRQQVSTQKARIKRKMQKVRTTVGF
jgi:DNA-binding CsgD family transcriptional regulator